MSSLFCHRGLQEHVVAGGVNPELDPHRITKAGNNAFHDAVKCGTNPLAVRVQILLRLHSVLSYKPNNNGDTPLHVAARLGNESFAMVLIDHAREPCHINDYTSLLKKANHVGNTALHEAVLNGHFKIVERLIDEDPTLTNLVNNAGESPLFLAVDRGFYDIASIILDTFPICSLLGRKGMNFMHAAVIRLYDPGNLVPTMIRENCFSFSLGVVTKALNKCGSQILDKGEDEFGWKPLHYAASMGHSRVVKLFLEAKKSLAYDKDKQGMTALHIAARNGHLGVIRKLMNECPDIGEVLDNGNRSALHIAVEHKKVHVAHTLLNTKAFIDIINEQDCKGNTALHVAAVCGYYEIFVSLASNSRTDKRIMNEMGMTALDIIGRSNLLGIVEKAIIKFKINTESNLLSLHEAAIVNQSTKSDEKVQEIQSSSTMTNESVPKEEIIDKEVKQMADINLVVSTLITDITFQAAISMAGAATYSSSSSLEAFTLFTAFNSLAFSFSAASMIIHIAVALYFKLLGKPHRYPFTLTMILTIASITLSVLAFFTGSKALLYEKKSKIVSSSNIWDIDFPEKITFFAFLAILIWVLLPLVLTTLYHLIILSSDDGLPLLLFEFKYGVLHYLQMFLK
ncbi:ankyrin repeat-containing protein At5g02620 isoform X2 [Cannabis sativa]|uniref:ankyrin repeat-containing protein At5g02620 isoform X2 n=1 Tax=Cannabis sativa TaxID=3483 RepID=UPI0029CA7316|nr:ankyrin repeat-containing protein At5g02620 isoform X2 [Cannabis sativa]